MINGVLGIYSYLRRNESGKATAENTTSEHIGGLQFVREKPEEAIRLATHTQDVKGDEWCVEWSLRSNVNFRLDVEKRQERNR